MIIWQSFVRTERRFIQNMQKIIGKSKNEVIYLKIKINILKRFMICLSSPHTLRDEENDLDDFYSACQFLSNLSILSEYTFRWFIKNCDKGTLIPRTCFRIVLWKHWIRYVGVILSTMVRQFLGLGSFYWNEKRIAKIKTVII